MPRTFVLTVLFAIGAYAATERNLPAAIIQFQTIPGGNIDGEPVNALATFTTSADTIAIKLENLQADPNSVKQVIYGLLFTVSTGQNSGTITSTMGFERTVSSDGTFVDSGLLNIVDWQLNTSGASLHLDRLAAPGQKKHGIIGPPNNIINEYDQAGGSIAGNGGHNPFWGGSADFVLNVPGVTADSTITAATFSFNTTPGNDVPGILVPEPMGIALLMLGITLLLGGRSIFA